ncbi:MAG: ribulose 1,5-bisphosphate carboxylase large subunit, partial [Deltaproteobacteria bacterium]|nr:ribulose 1,5-bisphosphate carboxylase large subunit [Deltaproteobacteria bacterium]
LMHPALLGSFTVSPAQGLSFRVLYGTLARLAGADAVVFPNHGGRFAFSPEDCREIVRGCEAPLGGLRTSLPAPAGGMSLARVPEMRAFYGDDVLLLIGGDLHRHGDLEGTCRRLRSMVELSPEVEP